MKRHTLLFLFFFGFIYSQGAYIVNLPQIIVQPDGTEIHCLASGDEYHHWLHDSLGYTIVQNPKTGYFTYAEVVNEDLIATDYIVKQQPVYPKEIQPHANISAKAWREKREAWNRSLNPVSSSSANTGVLNNIVIFIRFSDDTEFTTHINVYEQLFNNESADANSMRHYYNDVSYGKLDVITSFYPQTQSDGVVLSYKDTYSRNYYRPYSAGNPQGYSSEDQKKARAQTLLRNAVLAVAAGIPADLNVDFNNDGLVDNLCFIVKGDPEGWSELLWPQKVNFDNAYYVSINGKRCYTYNFQLENYTLTNVGVLCHEMFHSLGAPDLYHYDNVGVPAYPVGKWDVMELTSEPPQSMGAYMKYKYGNWIDSIPTITETGFYELQALHSSNENVCYKIPVPESNQEYLLVEYRQKTGVFEGSLPSSGLLIYRIWPHVNGNEHPNGDTVFDEVYLYRPGGGYSEKHEQAAFSTQLLRSNFYKNVTDPACVLTNRMYGSVGIHQVSLTANNTMRFYVVFGDDPQLFTKEESVLFSSSANNSKTIEVHTNLSGWTVSSEASWLSVSKDEQNKQITISTTSSNPSTNNRTALVYLNGGASLQQVISVTQSLGNVTLTVTPRTQTVPGEANSSAEYSVSTTYTGWEASTTADWVNLWVDQENSILKATAQTANNQSTERQAIIKVVSGNAQSNVIFIQSKGEGSFIPSIKEEKFRIFPNPVKDQLNIVTDVPVKEMTLINLWGEIVPDISVSTTGNQYQINLSSLAQGIYFLRLNTENQVYTHKITKGQN